MAKRELNAIVTHRIDLAPGLMVLRVAPDGWDLPDFKPGQYTVLGLPGSSPRCTECDPEERPPPADRLIQRAYSIASSSVAKEYMEFYITIVRSGALTPRIFELSIGDRIWLSPKCTGFFTLEEVPRDASVVLVATGTGLAPYVSMVRSQLTFEARRRIAIIHGARHSWDLGYQDELRSLARLSRALTYIPVISRPDAEPVPWRGEVGYVQDVWNRGCIEDAWGFRPGPEGTHVFLCGNPAMIESMEEILRKDGFREQTRKTPGQYHVERYW